MSITLALVLLQLQIKFQFSVIVLCIIILSSSYAIGRSRRLLSDWVREKDIIGEISFEENAIIIHDKDDIQYGRITHIHFRYSYIKGHQVAPYDIDSNGLATLSITTKDDITKTIKFVIETKEQFEFLSLLFKKWYQLGIAIKEEADSQKYKTICLKPIGRMSYKDIQALKEEIKPHI